MSIPLDSATRKIKLLDLRRLRLWHSNLIQTWAIINNGHKVGYVSKADWFSAMKNCHEMIQDALAQIRVLEEELTT